MYTSPDIQNEIIKPLDPQMLRDISADFQDSPFLTVMADETTDRPNQEQVIFILCWVTQDLQIHEELLGLCHDASIYAATLTVAIKDAICN